MDQWTRDFSILIVTSAILSGIAYYLQYYIFGDITIDRWNITHDAIRTIRMILIYILPVLYFFRKHGHDWKELGILPSKEKPVLSTIGGALVYFIAIYIFLKYRIFFGNWSIIPWNITLIKLLFIGIMASITDLWTRGFILLQLSEKYNEKTGIFWQNITWFVLHIYEIELLNSYIGYLGAILLTLTLGILGDIIALKTKSITGLMLGHILLNLAIILSAKGYFMI